MTSLTKALHGDELREQLHKLPRDIPSMYDMILSRVRNQPETHVRFAIETLCWATFCRRSLATEEIQHALSIDPISCRFNVRRLSSPNDIRDLCHGLVTVSADAITLVHNTARNYLVDYLHDRIQDIFPDVHAVIAKTCIHYLASMGSPRSHYTSRMSSSLARYAAHNLGYHLGQLKECSNQDILVPLEKLLNEPQTRQILVLLLDNLRHLTYTDLGLSFAGQLGSRDGVEYQRWDSWSEASNQSTDDQSADDQSTDDQSTDDQSCGSDYMAGCEYTALHLAAYLGWPSVVSRFAHDSSYLHEKAFGRHTPLALAIQASSWASIPILLENGAYVDLGTEEGYAVILLCAQQNQRDIVRNLILESRSPAALPVSASSAEQHATKNSKHFVLRNLQTAATVFVSALSAMLSTINCLSMCIKRHTKSRVKGPSEERHSVIVDQEPDSNWHLDVLLAAEAGDHINMQRLMNLTDTYARSSKWLATLYTALFLAAEFGHLLVVEKIFLSGNGNIDVNIRGLERTTLLHRAARHNDVALVEFLVQQGAAIDARDDRNETPLHANFNREHLQGSPFHCDWKKFLADIPMQSSKFSSNMVLTSMLAGMRACLCFMLLHVKGD